MDKKPNDLIEKYLNNQCSVYASTTAIDKKKSVSVQDI